MNPAAQGFHNLEGDNPMMMFMLLMIMCPGMFGSMGQNPMMMLMLMMMMGGKMF